MSHKYIIRTVISCAIIFLLFVGLFGCAGPIEPAAVSETPMPTPTHTPAPTAKPEQIYTGPVNPLTGMPSKTDVSAKRPCAVMINNIEAAQPQSGISDADIIYEALVEGGITRMLAVFQDIDDVGIIGSVRSSRHYYLDLAQGLDAIYIHAGGSPYAYDTIWSRGIDNIDGVNGYDDIYFRDSWRLSNLGYEHSLMIDTSLIPAFLKKQEIRSQHEEGYVCNLKFDKTSSAKTGQAANNISVKFSEGKNTEFSYDKAAGTYKAVQYGAEYVDTQNNKQVSPRNVIVIYTSVYLLSDDSSGRLDTVLTGSGDGYYACDGKYIPITWSKESPDSQFVYSTQDGKPITFGAGSSYVCILPYDNEVIFQ